MDGGDISLTIRGLLYLMQNGANPTCKGLAEKLLDFAAKPGYRLTIDTRVNAAMCIFYDDVINGKWDLKVCSSSIQPLEAKS